MAGICNPAHTDRGKFALQQFPKAMDMLLAVYMLVQEVAAM